MYEVWELPDTQLTDAKERDEALRQLDAECRRRYDQVVANGEGAQKITYRFDIRNQTGQTIMWLTYCPDTSRPYESVFTEEMLRSGQP